MTKLVAIPCMALLLAACATTPPIDLAGAETGLTPGEAAANIERVQGRRVAWGGVIVLTRNLKDATEIEVLSYPLDDSGRPKIEGQAGRRFLVVHKGYLESADYHNGRRLTAVGSVSGTRDGLVGEAPYVYPVLQAERLHLWPVEQRGRRDPNIRFGVGIGVILR